MGTVDPDLHNSETLLPLLQALHLLEYFQMKKMVHSVCSSLAEKCRSQARLAGLGTSVPQSMSMLMGLVLKWSRWSGFAHEGLL